MNSKIKQTKNCRAESIFVCPVVALRNDTLPASCVGAHDSDGADFAETLLQDMAKPLGS
jgi:hypothetical protein